MRNIVMILASCRFGTPSPSRRLRLLPLLILALLAACTSTTQSVLPLAPDIVGRSRVAAVELDLQPTARAAVAALDAAAKGRDGVAGQDLATLLPAAIHEAARRAELTNGRAFKLVVELDDLRAASAGSALLGGEDRMAGTVFVRDVETGAPLGQLYVDVNARTSGLMGLATRGGVRERLVDGFADRIARALAGR